MAASKSSAGRSGLKPDLATLGGLLVAIGGILGGLLLEGGKLEDVKQVTAAMIVLGGTFGAVMVTTPTKVLLSAVKRLATVFFDRSIDPKATIEEIIEYATQARRSGIVSLEQRANQVQDRFLRKALGLAVDGTDLQQLRKMMELDLSVLEHRGDAEAKVYEAAGGYSPTIGIIGAVLGLIQVMKHLADIDEVGRGIAVAFVATVYGVGAANLFFLPVAQKIKARVHGLVQLQELMLEGVSGIVEGMNPKLLRTKLEAYVSDYSVPDADASKTAKKKTAVAKSAPAES